MTRMSGSSIWWLLQGIVVAAAAVALVYGLWLQRAQGQAARIAGEVARETARLSLKAAELQAQSVQSAQAVVEAAARVQRLATRPALKIGLAVQGPVGDLGRTPVFFALRLRNVGHGTAVIDEVRLLVRGEAALTYGSELAAGADRAAGIEELSRRIESQVFQPAVGSSLQSLSGRLTVLPLAEEARALEAAGSVDLFQVQVFAHNAEMVEQGLATLSAEVSYRDLDGGHYTSAEQFRSL
jgi:hypothetical protein